MIVAIASPATKALRTPREAHGFIPIHKHNHQEDEVAVDLLIGASVKPATDEPSLDRKLGLPEAARKEKLDG